MEEKHDKRQHETLQAVIRLLQEGAHIFFVINMNFCTTSSQSWQIRSITLMALAQFVAGKPQTDF